MTLQKFLRLLSQKSLRDMNSARACSLSFPTICQSVVLLRKSQCPRRLHSLTSACFGQRFSVESRSGLAGTLVDCVISLPFSHAGHEVAGCVDGQCVPLLVFLTWLSHIHKQGEEIQFSSLQIILWNGANTKYIYNEEFVIFDYVQTLLLIEINKRKQVDTEKKIKLLFQRFDQTGVVCSGKNMYHAKHFAYWTLHPTVFTETPEWSKQTSFPLCFQLYKHEPLKK